MQPTHIKTFTRRLLAEALFYDEEFGALATVSLVDDDSLQERFLGAYLPDDDIFLVEEAIEWEDEAPDTEVGYALATDSKDYGRFDTPEQAAEALLDLAMEENLSPSITILFEDEV